MLKTFNKANMVKQTIQPGVSQSPSAETPYE